MFHFKTLNVSEDLQRPIHFYILVYIFYYKCIELCVLLLTLRLENNKSVSLITRDIFWQRATHFFLYFLVLYVLIFVHSVSIFLYLPLTPSPCLSLSMCLLFHCKQEIWENERNMEGKDPVWKYIMLQILSDYCDYVCMFECTTI